MLLSLSEFWVSIGGSWFNVTSPWGSEVSFYISDSWTEIEPSLKKGLHWLDIMPYWLRLVTFLCAYLVAKFCPTLCDPMDCTCQAPLSKEFCSKNPVVGCYFLLQGIVLIQGWTSISCTGRRILYRKATREAQELPYPSIDSLVTCWLNFFGKHLHDMGCEGRKE